MRKDRYLSRTTDVLSLPTDVIDRLSDGVLFANVSGLVTFANIAAERLLGAKPATLVDVVPDQAIWEQVLDAQDDTPRRIESGIPGLILTAGPRRDADGAPAGVLVLLHAPTLTHLDRPEAHDLNEIALAVASSQDIATILARTFALLQPLIGCDNVSIAVKEEHADRTYHLRYLTPGPTPLSTIPRAVLGDADGEAIHVVWETGRTVIVDDTVNAPRYAEDAALAAAGIQSYGIYPLRGDRDLIGSLNLSTRRPHAFGARESRIINFVAHHIALAVEKILLLEAVEDRARAMTRVLAKLPVGVAVLRPTSDFAVAYVSDQARDFFDDPAYPAETLLDRPLRESLPATEADELLATSERVARSGEPAEIAEFTHRSATRDLTYWNIRWVPLQSRGGMVESIVVILLNMTEQVQARRRIQDLAQAAAEQATALSAIISSMAEGVYVADRNGRIVLVNEAGAALAGMSVAEALDPALTLAARMRIRYLDGRPMEPDGTPLRRALRGETRSDWEQLVNRVDTGEEVQLRIAYSPIRDEQSLILGAVAVASDVTRIRQLERQREEFLSIAAHELKTPVTSIKLFTQAMLRTLQRRGELAPERAERDLRTILRQIDRLIGLVDDLLDVSRIRTGRLVYDFAPLDLVELARATVERFRAQLDPGSAHRLVFEPAQATLMVEGDADRLDQVFTNLLVNAIKYSPGGGEIRVGITPAETGGWVRATVSDQGVGLTPGNAEAIFEPFSRADTARNIAGIGLGLYISHEIVSRHAGRIRAESEGPGLGTTFIVELPLQQPVTPGDEA